ncbi:MAG: hypothetical protein E7812_02180 [Phenylobacterium sp.]|nr:MAG: hypothetical protein E7812_02180 [Phenylobacterium sp.]
MKGRTTWAVLGALLVNFGAEAASAELKTVIRPEIGVESEVEVGQSMVSVERSEITDAVRLKNTGLAKGLGSQVEVPPGTYKLTRSTPEGFYYEAAGLQDVFFGIPQQGIYGGIFIPSDVTKPPAIYEHTGAFPNSPKLLKTQALQIERAAATEAAGGFRRDLVYAGVSQGVVSITYREFSNDLARPAFTQELHYDLKEGDLIGFRGSRFRILKASNISIRYVVDKPLAQD